MKVGDLVQKRWGRIEPHQQETVGVCLALQLDHIRVAYSNGKWGWHKAREFEVVSESR